MPRFRYALTGAALMLGVSTLAAQAQMVEPTTPPEPPSFAAQGEVTFVGVKDIFEYKALPEYHEPAYVTDFVGEGLLPPVAARLPKEPLVFKTANMPDEASTATSCATSSAAGHRPGISGAA